MAERAQLEQSRGRIPTTRDFIDIEAIRKRVVEDALPADEFYEARAERFYRATGMMAPGKDAPAAMGGPPPEERAAEWKRWLPYDRQEWADLARMDRAALLVEVDALRRAPPDAAILAEELEARADTLELAARSGARLPSYPGGIEQLGQRVRILRREADRLRGRA